MLDSPEFTTGASETGSVLAETPALIPEQVAQAGSKWVCSPAKTWPVSALGEWLINHLEEKTITGRKSEDKNHVCFLVEEYFVITLGK